MKSTLSKTDHLKVSGFVTLAAIILFIVLFLNGNHAEAVGVGIGFFMGLVAMNESRNGQAQ